MCAYGPERKSLVLAPRAAAKFVRSGDASALVEEAPFGRPHPAGSPE
jgi:hypothetical protein